MRLSHLFAVLAFTATVISCKNGSSKEEQKAEPIPAPAPTNVTPAPAPASTTPTATTPPVNTAPVTTTTTAPPATNIQPATVTPAATAATGLNPKHGMPGHRCDIPEGAPLNSKPTSNIVPAQQAGQNAVTVSKGQSVAIPQPTPVTNTPSVATGAGLNPEHGKPGHRCDIAVGAPLNSPPATKQ